MKRVCHIAIVRNHSRLFTIAFMCVVLVGVAWFLLRPLNEPVYEGRPLSYWLNHPKPTSVTNLLANLPLPRLQGTTTAFPQMDTNAIPFLIKVLERPDGTFERGYWDLWRKLGPRLRRYLPKPVYPGKFRAHAAIILHDMGTNAQPAIPALIRVMKSDANEKARVVAAACLFDFGGSDPRVRAAFNEVLKDTTQPPVVHNLARSMFRSARPEAAESGVVTNADFNPLPKIAPIHPAEISESNH